MHYWFFSTFSILALLASLAAPRYFATPNHCYQLPDVAEPVCCASSTGMCEQATPTRGELVLDRIVDNRAGDIHQPTVQLTLRAALSDRTDISLYRRCGSDWHKILAADVSHYPGGSYVRVDSRFGMRSFYSSEEEGYAIVPLTDENYSRYSGVTSSVAFEQTAFGPLVDERCTDSAEYIALQPDPAGHGVVAARHVSLLNREEIR